LERWLNSYKQSLIGANLWTVKVDKVVSGSIISEGYQCVVGIAPYEVISETCSIGLGYMDPTINPGDKVECYGKGVSDSLSLADISLDESRSYYLKKVTPAPTVTCTGTISGYVYDAVTNRPIEGAAISFVPSGLSTYSGSLGYYHSASQFCAGTTQTIICNALNYESATQSVTTDSYGNAQYNFYLQPMIEPETLPTDLAVRYKCLAEYWSPVLVQYISMDDPKKDYILKFEFDGDFNAWNNEDNIEKMDLVSVAQCRAFVYYWVVETETHFFIGYGFFHPRDWKYDLLIGHRPHENDFEGIFLCIEKDQENFGDWGQLVAMLTTFHRSERTCSIKYYLMLRYKSS